MKPYIDSGLRDYPHIRTLIAVYCNPGRTLYVLYCVIIISINHDCNGITIAKGVLLLIENELQ